MAYTNGSLVKSVDWLTICIYIALIVLGWVSVCGASYDFGDVNLISFETRAGKQLLWMECSLGLGFILLMLNMFISVIFFHTITTLDGMEGTHL